MTTTEFSVESCPFRLSRPVICTAILAVFAMHVLVLGYATWSSASNHDMRTLHHRADQVEVSPSGQPIIVR